MKIKIDNFEIDIKAKRDTSDKYNREDTFYFLNMVSMAFSEASEHYEMLKLFGLQKEFHQIDMEIFQYLKDRNYYNG